MREVSIVSALALASVLVGCGSSSSGSATDALNPSASASANAVNSAAASASAMSVSSAATTASPASAPFVVPDAIIAQHILIAYKGAKNAPKEITRSKADAKTLAEKVRDEARGGASFESLVAKYSEDPGSKDRMGSVGKFTRDKMTKAFSDAAFALRVDQVSDAVETPFGFHIIKRTQ